MQFVPNLDLMMLAVCGSLEQFCISASVCSSPPRIEESNRASRKTTISEPVTCDEKTLDTK